MSKKLSGRFKVKDPNKAKAFASNYSNFISCIPNVKDIKDKKFKIDAVVGAMRVTVDGELIDYKLTDNGYVATIQIRGPGVTTTVTTNSTLIGDEVSWESEYKSEGSMVPMLGALLDNSVQAMINQSIECIKNKINQ
jgi:carbon monoxide dehydrogenase subunit G